MNPIIPTLNLTEDNDVTRGELQEQTTMRFLSKGALLFTNHIPDDTSFSGVAYCLKSYISQDLYDNTKWSGVFHLIDGEGVKFRAYFYGMDVKFEEHEGPVYIEGVKRFRANTNGYESVEYRLSQITQPTINCDKSYFLKELANYQQVKETFKKNLGLIQNNTYKYFIDTLDANFKFLNTIETETFSDFYGTSVGARMEAFNKGCSMIYALGTMVGSTINLELCYLALLLKLWKPDVAIEGQTIDAYLSDDIFTEEQILTSSLTRLDKIKLVDALKDNRKSIEGQTVSNIYKLIAEFLKSEDMLKTKQTGKLGLFS